MGDHEHRVKRIVAGLVGGYLNHVSLALNSAVVSEFLLMARRD